MVPQSSFVGGSSVTHDNYLLSLTKHQLLFCPWLANPVPQAYFLKSPQNKLPLKSLSVSMVAQFKIKKYYLNVLGYLFWTEFGKVNFIDSI